MTSMTVYSEKTPQVTRRYDGLTEKEREKVDTLIKELDYKNPLNLIAFGSSAADELSNFTSNLFKGMKIKDFQSFEEALTNLMQNIKQVDPDSLQEVQVNKWKNWPIIGKIVDSEIAQKVSRLIEQQTSIEDIVVKASDNLERTKLALMKEMESISRMKSKSYDYAIDQELIYIALDSAKTEAEEEIQLMESKYNQNDLMEVNQLADLHASAEAIDRKRADVLTYRTMALQNIPKLGYLYTAEEAIVRKIDDVIRNVIPIWRQQFALALFSYHVKNAAFVLQTARETTEALYKANGLMLEEALTATVKEINALPVSFEALKEQNQKMFEMFDNLSRLEENLREEREKNIPEIMKIQEEIIGRIAKTDDVKGLKGGF